MFIQNFQRVLSGDTTSGFTDPAEAFSSENKPLKAVGNMKLAAADSLFRQEFEKSEFSLVTLASGKYRELQEMFFFTPITGFCIRSLRY
jgi:hypothetical protein